MRSTLSIVLILVAFTQGCVTANTWKSERSRIISQPENTVHALKVREDLVESNIFYRGAAGVKIQKYQARKAPFVVDSFSSWDHWWAFPITAPLDLTLLVVSSPYACVQKAMFSAGDRNLGPPQELKEGETLPAYLTGNATLTYTGLESPLKRTLYNGFHNNYGASFAFNETAKLQAGKDMPQTQRLLLTYQDMILACLQQNRQEVEFVLSTSGLRFRQTIPLLKIFELHDKTIKETLKRRDLERYVIAAAERMDKNAKVNAGAPAEVKDAVIALKKRLNALKDQIEKHRVKARIQLAEYRAKKAAKQRKDSILQFYKGLRRANSYYNAKKIVRAGDYELLILPVSKLPKWAIVFDGRWVAKTKYRGKKAELPAITTVEICRKILPCDRCQGSGQVWSGKYTSRSTNARTSRETVRVVDQHGRTVGYRQENVTRGGGTQFSKAMNDCESCDKLGVDFK